jgi:hypothetical protein
MLCELAAKEEDPYNLFALTQEINRLLQEKEDRLKAAHMQPDDFASGKAHSAPVELSSPISSPLRDHRRV